MADFHIPVTPPDESDPRGWTTAWIAIVGIVLTFVIVVMLQVFYYRTQESEFERKVVAAEPVELLRVEQEQREQLSGSASIPIEEAMRLIVQENGGGR